jgi:MFS family permease
VRSAQARRPRGRLTGSAALAQVVTSAPALALGPLIGVVIDRFDKKSVMIASLVLRAITMVGMIFCQSPDTLWALYALTFLKFCFSFVYNPARTAIVPSMVSKQVPQAHGLPRPRC